MNGTVRPHGWSVRRLVVTLGSLFVIGLIAAFFFAMSLRSEADTRKEADCGLRLRLERLLQTVPEDNARPAVTEFIQWLDYEIERVGCDKSYLGEPRE